MTKSANFLTATSGDDLTSILPFLPLSLANRQVLFVDTGSDEATLNTFVSQSVARLLVLNLNSRETRQSVANVEYLNSSLSELDLGDQTYNMSIFVHFSSVKST
jgi:hypothetical protein